MDPTPPKLCKQTKLHGKQKKIRLQYLIRLSLEVNEELLEFIQKEFNYKLRAREESFEQIRHEQIFAPKRERMKKFCVIRAETKIAIWIHTEKNKSSP